MIEAKAVLYFTLTYNQQTKRWDAWQVYSPDAPGIIGKVYVTEVDVPQSRLAEVVPSVPTAEVK